MRICVTVTSPYPQDRGITKAEGTSTPYRFDVLAQLANIPAGITLYELLRLSKSTREALREALANAEFFMAQIPVEPREEDKEDYLHACQHTPCITFMPDDMQVKGKHDRPLYFTGYIGSSEVSCISVDLGSTLRLCPGGSCSTWESPLID